MARHPGLRTVAVLTAALTLTGCGLLGGPKASLPAVQVMTVMSPVFSQGVIPAQFTCHGAGESPPLYWSGAPSGTRAFALVVDDSAAPITPYVYWIVFNISPATPGIQPGRLPSGARQADNSKGVASYDPPCSPEKSHQYRLTVYALSSPLQLPSGSSLDATWSAIARLAIARGRLTADVRR